MNLQRNYDLDLAEYKDRNSITEEEYRVFHKIADIVAEILSIKGERLESDRVLGVIQARRELRVASLLNIPSVMQQALYRKSKTADVDECVTFAWQRLCDHFLAQVSRPEAHDRRRFERKVAGLKRFMFEADIREAIPRVRDFFLSCGTRLVVVKHYRGAPIHGMTRKNADGTIDLCLTIRRGRADIFWFSLFHEVAHILHGDFANGGLFHDDETEERADQKAAALLIQEDSYRDFVAAGNFSWDRIADLAHHSNVPEYIVVGRLQHDGHLPWQHEYSRRIPIYTWE
jgi:HTH-type transcriptional regulator/antitoxin HigA